MRALAKLRTLFSALICGCAAGAVLVPLLGALMRRVARARAKDSVVLPDVDLPVVPSSSSKTDVPGAVSAAVSSGTQESAVPIAQTLPSAQAEGQLEMPSANG